MGRFYVTTPIYYVNDVPHLGNAYTTIVADALRRFHAVQGDDTFMLTGMDEHGLKIEREATARGLSPKAFVDTMSAPFREAWPELHVEADHFIRTTDPEHERYVQELWKVIEARGDLYLGNYEDWYCVGCEGFKTEKELLPGNLCPDHKKPVERVKEETYFFRLSKYQDVLLDLYRRRPELIQPESRRNEVLSFVEGGLKDLSVSRTSFSWGIPVPSNPKHVMYVWFDALTNYRSAVAQDGRERFWPKKGQPASERPEVVHLVGKDILRFHTVYWPAFLLAAGYDETELPSTVFAHGFLTVDGQKMSKSLRNSVDPRRLARELGADVLRYHLLRAISFGQDGDFDHAALLERYNADLGKNLGNLLNRTLGLCQKLSGGAFPDVADDEAGELEATFRADVERAFGVAREAWLGLQPHRALEATLEVAAAANGYVDRAAPWAEAKKPNGGRAGIVLAHLLRALESLSVALWPALPAKADAMREQLGLPRLAPSVATDLFPTGLAAGRRKAALAPQGPLFPTYDADATKALLEKLVPAAPDAAVASEAPTLRKPPVGPGGTLEERMSPVPTLRSGSQVDTTELVAPIQFDDFVKVELKVGLVTAAEKVPKKDKLLKLAVDVGEGAPRTIVAGIALSFTPEALVGRKVVVVANLVPRDFGKGLVSHGMLLATGPSDALVLASADAAPGARLG